MRNIITVAYKIKNKYVYINFIGQFLLACKPNAVFFASRTLIECFIVAFYPIESEFISEKSSIARSQIPARETRNRIDVFYYRK